jgi:nuclear GTP-binding protein
VRRVDPGQLLRVYRIPEYDSVESFLINLAKARGFLRKGGIVDVYRAAKAVLIDWNSGVIPFYTLPPHVDEESLMLDKDVLQSVYKLDELSLPGSGVPISRYCQFSSDGRMGGEDLADMFGEIGVTKEGKEEDEMEEEADDEDEDEMEEEEDDMDEDI